LKEPIDGDCLILSGMEFQTGGAANLKALRPMAVELKGTCSRLCEEERRSSICFGVKRSKVKVTSN